MQVIGSADEPASDEVAAGLPMVAIPDEDVDVELRSPRGYPIQPLGQILALQEQNRYTLALQSPAHLVEA